LNYPTYLHVATNAKVAFFYNERGQRVSKETYSVFAGQKHTNMTYYVRDASGNIMAVYTQAIQDLSTRPSPPILEEHSIYGNSRIGVFKRDKTTPTTGNSFYELTDHLGNVRAVITKTPTGLLSLTNKTDYYPFGMPMPDKTTTDGNYRYAFQGQEKDPETGMEAFELRLWDGRLGRWLSVDPYGQYASPYLGMGNNPINMVDSDGGWVTFTVTQDKKTGVITVNMSIHGKILNLSKKQYSEVWGQITNQMNRLHRIFGSNYFEIDQGGGKKVRVQMNIKFVYTYAKDISAVSKRDHVIALVNKGKYTTNTGALRNASFAAPNGQNSIIATNQISFIPHEVAHNLGMTDLYDIKGYKGTKDNLMYNSDSNKVDKSQLLDIFANVWGYLGKGTIKLNNFGSDSDLKTTIKYSSDYENPDWNKIRD
jgi:RHS repeat-associated protein